MEIYIIPNGQNHIQFYTVVGPFDKGATALGQQGIEPLSAQHLALSRRLAGKQSPVSRKWSWVAENVVCDNGGDTDVLLVDSRHAPILKDPTTATAAHRDVVEFFVRDYTSLRERASADPTKAIESGVLLLSRSSLREEIPTAAFGDEPQTLFLFRGEAIPYGKFLRQGIDRVPFWTVSADYAKQQSAPFAWPLAVNCLVGGSCLDGVRDLVNHLGRVSGVRFVEGPAERAALDIPLELAHNVELSERGVIVDGRPYVAAKALEELISNLHKK